MKKTGKILLICTVVVLLIITVFFVGCIYLMSPVSKESEEKTIVIEQGSTMEDIANLLKEEDLIRNEQVFIYYARLKKADNIYAASYYLNQNMGVDEILDVLLEGGHNANEIRVTFNEGINMRKVATIISENTNNTYDEVMAKLDDTEYINSLIEKYWFLTDEITNTDIYYPLEGYLYPDTYFLSGADATIEEIFTVMLDEMGKILENYRTDIENSNYTVHEIITMASIVELEGIDKASRKDIAGVFYNRLNGGMSLGSDVTTYYAVQVDMGERDLYQRELDSSNPYNTRGPGMIGKLPVGPIAIVSQESLEAAIYPNDNDYLYFVADKNNNVHFTKTDAEHQAIIDQLIDEGLWYEW